MRASRTARFSLEDVALMNDALTVQEENERRFMAAKEKERA